MSCEMEEKITEKTSKMPKEFKAGNKGLVREKEIYGMAKAYRKLSSHNIWDVQVVGGWAHFLQFLLSEDVDPHNVRLCMSVLASLGGTVIHNLARSTLDADISER